MTDEIKPFVVTFEEDGQRLDKWINFHFNHVSKIMMEKLCRTGQIRVNSSRVKPNYKLIEKKGPSHSPIFKVSVSCLDKENISGMGKTIREAERSAAEKFLNKYKKMNEK